MNTMVSDLLIEDLNQWDRDKIFRNFEKNEATQIVSIPLSTTGLADKFNWHQEKNGCYLVKSAYHLFYNERDKGRPSGSSTSDDELWKQIWKVPLPNSIRNFLWRLAKNILPTRVNL